MCFGTDHDAIEIWSPTEQLIELGKKTENYNHSSYVLSIVHGDCRIVLGGDATEEAWEDILRHHGGALPKTNLLKAAHHGRESGYHPASVRSMNPDHVIVSVGKIPETDASNKYRSNPTSKVFTTRRQGTISASCYRDGRVILRNVSGEIIS